MAGIDGANLAEVLFEAAAGDVTSQKNRVVLYFLNNKWVASVKSRGPEVGPGPFPCIEGNRMARGSSVAFTQSQALCQFMSCPSLLIRHLQGAQIPAAKDIGGAKEERKEAKKGKVPKYSDQKQEGETKNEAATERGNLAMWWF